MWSLFLFPVKMCAVQTGVFDVQTDCACCLLLCSDTNTNVSFRRELPSFCTRQQTAVQFVLCELLVSICNLDSELTVLTDWLTDWLCKWLTDWKANYPSKSLEQSLYFKSNLSSTNQETPRLLRNPKFHHRIHYFPPSVPVQSQINRFRFLSSCFFKILFNTVLPSTPLSSNWSFSFMFLNQSPVGISLLPHTCYIPH